MPLESLDVKFRAIRSNFERQRERPKDHEIPENFEIERNRPACLTLLKDTSMRGEQNNLGQRDQPFTTDLAPPAI